MRGFEDALVRCGGELLESACGSLLARRTKDSPIRSVMTEMSLWYKKSRKVAALGLLMVEKVIAKTGGFYDSIGLFLRQELPVLLC